MGDPDVLIPSISISEDRLRLKCTWRDDKVQALANTKKTIFRKLSKIYTAGLPFSHEPTKKQFASKPEGLQQFRDHRWKAPGGENSDLL